MKKQTIIIIIVIVLLITVLFLIEWLKTREQHTAYGISQSFLQYNQRNFTWLTTYAYENSSLQLKKVGENWENIRQIELLAQRSSYENEANKQIYTYRVSVEELESGQSYNYRIVANGKLISKEFTFTVAPTQLDSFQFIHVTDTQGVAAVDYEQWGNTLQQALRFAPTAQFVVHGGDATEDPFNVQEWKWFFDKAPELATIPFFVTTGNHEQIKGDSSSYQAHVTMPSNGSEKLPLYTTYYIQYQNMLLISMNTEDNIKLQSNWLQDVLEQHGEKADWVIVSMHRGIYGANRYEEAEEWTQLFDQYGVDLVLQGHNHSYSRSFPLKKGKKTDEEGTIYVTLNAAGSKLNEKKKDKAYQAVAFQNGKSMFAIVDVTSDKLIYSAYDIDGKLLDQFELLQ